MVVKDSFTSGMAATREKILRVGGVVPGESGVAEEEVSVDNIVRGDGDG